MLGAIIGDIAGSAYEFNRTNDYNFEMFGNGCGFTDDTICTVAVADAILRHKDYGESLHEWCRRYPNPKGGYGGRFHQWVMSDNPKPYNSLGNGSAMRVSPVAWAARTLEECEQLAKYSAEVTHDHPDGIAGAQATAGACWLGLHGASKEEIKAYVERFYKLDFTLDEIRPDYHFGHFQALNAGTVPYAVQAFLESSSFEDCIRNTMSIGGDSDTLGAIAGAIAESFYGVPDAIWAEAEKRLDEDARELVTAFYAQEKSSKAACVSGKNPLK